MSRKPFWRLFTAKAIFESEVVLVNEIMSKYFDQNVYDLMSEQEKLILEHLMMPFATEHGVDETFYKLVA
jgi:hypothetical protein